MDKITRGKYYENLALNYLKKQKLTCVTQNYHCRWGEIDLVMQDKSSLVFVEVRFRGNTSYVNGAVSVDAKKQSRLSKAALHYLSQHAKSNAAARFDVVSISLDGDGKEEIEWIVNAFEGSH